MANLEGTKFNAKEDIYKQSEDLKLLRKNIDEIFVKLDLESRAQLVKIVIKDFTENSNTPKRFEVSVIAQAGCFSSLQKLAM